MAKKYYESKTPAWQRWAIWIIAIAMVGGTVLTYVVIFIANNNTNANPTQIAYNKYLDEQQKKQDELAAQQQAVIDKYVAFDDAYADQVGAFDATAVTELTVSVLKDGDGAVVKDSDNISANYTGWTADGKIFDTTRKTSDATTAPISFSLSGVIAGWTQGLAGQKVGGVYLLTIPSRLAYGDSVPTGYPAGPLKFIVEITAIN